MTGDCVLVVTQGSTVELKTDESTNDKFNIKETCCSSINNNLMFNVERNSNTNN